MYFYFGIAIPCSLGNTLGVALSYERILELHFPAYGLSLAIPGVHHCSHFPHLLAYWSLYALSFASAGTPRINQQGSGPQIGAEAGPVGVARITLPA